MSTWKAMAGLPKPNTKTQNDSDDDWETDPDFINDVTEQEQRWGAKTVEGSGRIGGAIDVDLITKELQEEDAKTKEMFIHGSQKDSCKGFGGKYGVETDRVDKSAVGWDHVEKLALHTSQKDHSVGFGGKYGVQSDRVDKSAHKFEDKSELEHHPSQKDYNVGFGGKYGVQKDRVDKSALGWGHIEKVEKHESQKDYSMGFGGKYGVQSDRVDKSAVGWEHHENVEKHSSQKDYSSGFGGKFKVETNRMDKSAHKFEDKSELEHHPSQTSAQRPTTVGKVKMPSFIDSKAGQKEESRSNAEPQSVGKLKIPNFIEQQSEKKNTELVSKGKANSLKSKFENLSKMKDEEDKQKLEEERIKRMEKEKREKEQAKLEEQERQTKLKEMQQLSREAEGENEDDEDEELAAERVERDDDRSAGPFINRIGVSVLPAGLAQAKKEEKIKQEETVLVQKTDDVDELEQEISNLEVEEESPIHSELETIQEDSLSEEVVLVNKKEEQPEEQPQSPKTEIRTGLKAMALFDYDAADVDEISFLPGEVIINVEQVDPGWWRGECPRGCVGLFPANYVKLID